MYTFDFALNFKTLQMFLFVSSTLSTLWQGFQYAMAIDTWTEYVRSLELNGDRLVVDRWTGL